MTSIGKYEMLKLLGSGAYADVYCARDTQLKHRVALKVLKPALIADLGLEQIPNYPDPLSIFPTLGLRPAPRRQLPPREILRQGLAGLLVGAAAGGLLLYFTFLLLTARG